MQTGRKVTAPSLINTYHVLIHAAGFHGWTNSLRACIIGRENVHTGFILPNRAAQVSVPKTGVGDICSSVRRVPCFPHRSLGSVCVSLRHIASCLRVVHLLIIVVDPSPAIGLSRPTIVTASTKAHRLWCRVH